MKGQACRIALLVCGLVLLAGCAAVPVAPIARWESAPCKPLYVYAFDEHRNFAWQGTGGRARPGLCRFRCQTSDVEAEDSPSMLRARLEPWCRAHLPDDGRPLTGRLATGDYGERIYELVAEFEAIEKGDDSRLCETYVAHQHNPDWLWFAQDDSRPGERAFTCGIGEVRADEDEASARSRLEPWCREQIFEAMDGSRRCRGTRFAVAAPRVRLLGEFVTDDGGGRDYLLKGRVDAD